MSAEASPDRCAFCAKWGQEVMIARAGRWHVICHPCGATGPIAETPEEAVAMWNTRPDPQRYAIGLITEEAGEVLQLLGKALRFGLDHQRRDGESARTLLPIETGDLGAALKIGVLAGLWDDEDAATREQVKLRKLLNPASVDDQGRRLAPDLGRCATAMFERMEAGDDR